MNAGSPPHTRGIPDKTGVRPVAVRFTPAYAGNTYASRDCFIYCKVHPRIRGEYRLKTGNEVFGQGSPPHTRGIQGKKAFPSVQKGFTPAYAGNTIMSQCWIAAWKVHPRIRGEY